MVYIENTINQGGEVSGGAVLFTGINYNSIDSKNRMIVPSKHRNQLGSGCYITRGLDRCLYIYKEEDWEAKAEAIKEMPTTNPKVRAFKRAIFGNAQKCEFDGQGRVIIPPNLIEFARINKELVTVGSNEVVEVWAKEVYEGPISEQLLSKEESYDDLIEYGI